jgi:hypothetical protein
MISNNGKRVLISGHSNTTPTMVNKLIGESKYSDMSDTDNKTLFIVNILNSKAEVEIRSVSLKKYE